MPLPLLFLLGSGAIAAAARGAAWLAERKVKETNELLRQVEARARQLNESYRDQRQSWRSEYERKLAVHSASFDRFKSTTTLDLTQLGSWTPEQWVIDRMGDLTIGPPLLISPNFNPPPGQNQLAGMRAVAQGRSVSVTNPTMGNVMQGAGFVTATGSYVSQQTNLVGDAQKYIAGAQTHMETVRRTIYGFGARFVSEVASDRRNVERLEQLLKDLSQFQKTDELAKSKFIVFRGLIVYLEGLVAKYA